MRFKKYKDNVYGAEYCFIFDIDTVDKIPQFLQKKDKNIYKQYQEHIKEGPINDDFSGYILRFDNLNLILIKKNKDNNVVIATVVHELLHAMFYVFHDLGVEIKSGENNEHCTYYLDHLVYEALK